MKYVYLLIVTLGLAACQSAPEQPALPRVFADLYVRYLEDGQQLKAQASFFTGDSLRTAHPLDVENGVSFLGSGMGKRNIQDQLIRYQYENFGEFPKTLRFRMMRDEGQFMDFEASMPPLKGFSFPDTLYIDQPISFTIQPGQLTPDQTLVVLFSDSNNKAISAEFKGPISEEELQITPAQLEGMHSGPGQLYLVKKQTLREESGDRASVFTIEFYSKAVDFMAIEG